MSNNCVSRFSDLLSDRRTSTDHLLWVALHDCSAPENPTSRRRTPRQIRDSVLEHASIRSLLSHSPHLRPRVESILDEMAHTWSLSAIRFVGYFVTKVLTRVCSHVWVEERIPVSGSWSFFCGTETLLHEAIGRLIRESAVVLYLPTHRSYLDFVLLSYVCFAMSLPLPAIAAGNDFLSLNQVASLLRACGAFFIRRSSLRDDPLYWQTLKAYMEEQVTGGERPVEFFIEGTRSRSGKGLPAKMGLFSVAVNLFLSGSITDLVLLPICISYERLMEETLYASEVSPGASGVKPKETTAHLVSGVKNILNQNYGSVYVRFSEPISVRQESYQFRGEDVRKQCNHELSDSSELIRSHFVNHLLKRVTKAQTWSTIVSPFDLFAFVVVAENANHEPICTQAEAHFLTITFSNAIADVNQMLQLISAENLWTDRLSPTCISSDVRDSFKIHETKFLTIDENELCLKWDMISRNKLRIYANKVLQLLISDCICCYVNSSRHLFKRVANILEIEFCALDQELLDSYFVTSSKAVSGMPPDMKSLLGSYVSFYLISYEKLVLWLESDVNNSHLPLHSKSLTMRAQREVSLPSDLISNFWTLIKKRVAPSSAVVTTDVIRQMREELAPLVLCPRDDFTLKSKL